MTFRSSKIVYYGPHECPNCGDYIAKMGTEFGGSSFTYPRGPIYPNTEWHPHVCDPDSVAAKPRAANDNPPVPFIDPGVVFPMLPTYQNLAPTA